MKLLICPGLPRSGTTYLFEQLTQSGSQSFNVPTSKETNYFSRHDNVRAEIFSQLYPNFNKDLYFLDFSPAYLSNSQAISRLARAAGDHDVKVILHLREPVSQA